jgi:molybdate transport system permease protein
MSGLRKFVDRLMLLGKGFRQRSALLIALFVLVISGGISKTAQAASRREIKVQAAASLTELIDVLEIEFEKLHPQFDLLINLASSGQCAKNITDGVDCDLFLAAGVQPVKKLIELGRASAGDRQDIFANSLVIVVAPENQLVSCPHDLLQPSVKHIAIGDPGHAPVGYYARDALTRLGIWEQLVKKRKLMREIHVKAALLRVAGGFADAGIVYATDALRKSQELKVAYRFPKSTHAAILYPALLLSAAENREGGLAFIKFMRSESAMRLAASHGFVPASAIGPGSVGRPGDDNTNISTGTAFSIWKVLRLSLLTSLLSLLLVLIPGIAVSWFLARSRWPFTRFIEALVYAPLVLPPVVVGYGLLLLFSPGSSPLGGMLKSAGVDVVGTWKAVVLACAVVSFPLFVRSLKASMQNVDPRLERTSRLLGAGRWRTFFKVTFPLSFRGLAAGCILAFTRALGEFGATVTFAGLIKDRTFTLPLAIFDSIILRDRPVLALNLVAVSLGISVLAVVAAEFIGRSNRGGKLS